MRVRIRFVLISSSINDMHIWCQVEYGIHIDQDILNFRFSVCFWPSIIDLSVSHDQGVLSIRLIAMLKGYWQCKPYLYLHCCKTGRFSLYPYEVSSQPLPYKHKIIQVQRDTVVTV